MLQSQNFAKIIFIILAVCFAPAAKAGGQVGFQFQFQVNGNHNQLFNQFNFFGNNGGHYHTNSHGQHYICQNPNHHQPVIRPKPQPKYLINSKKQLVRHMHNMGYRKVHHIKRSGGYYTLRAISPNGHKMWLKVDRRHGNIRASKVLVWNVYK